VGEAATMRVLAGYRNRLVHLYHEVSAEELYEVCLHQLSDVELVRVACQRWLRKHPEKLDEVL